MNLSPARRYGCFHPNENNLLQLTDNRSLAVFIAALNALMRHLSIAEKTIHCKDDSPPLCILDLVKHIQKNFVGKHHYVKLRNIGDPSGQFLGRDFQYRFAVSFWRNFEPDNEFVSRAERRNVRCLLIFSRLL